MAEIAGFEALTDTGLYQIDGENMSFALAQHVTLTTANGALDTMGSNFGTVYYFNCPVVSFAFSANMPIIAYYSENSPVALVKCVKSNGVWTAQFWSLAATTFEVYIFDRLDTVPQSNSGCGLQVWNDQGVLVADSGIPMFRPVQYVSGNVVGAGPGYGQWGWPGGRTADYSQPSRSKIASACVVTAHTQAGGSSSGSGSHIQQTGWLGISAWKHGPAGAAQWSWNSVNYGDKYGTGNAVDYGESFSWSALLIDVSGI